jgi:hypothetical protein
MCEVQGGDQSYQMVITIKVRANVNHAIRREACLTAANRAP